MNKTLGEQLVCYVDDAAQEYSLDGGGYAKAV